MNSEIKLADDARTVKDRNEIDAFLHRVLPEEERDFIESYFISDDATILDCSMAGTDVLIANCKEAYGITLSVQELRMPLWVLWSYVVALS